MRRLLVVLVLLAPAPASAWIGREHRALGAESYTAACKRLEEKKDRDAATASRFQLACGNLTTQAFIYGQGTRVSGDFLASPADFVTALGVSNITKNRHFWKLALENWAHFHPLATREWRDFHKVATEEALAASKLEGVAQIEAFEQAFYDSAFGDHFLQDSFAAGHMGFNRAGSSAAASKGYHDEWGERGRWISNRRGAVWKTYGDGRLDIPENREGRAHVLAASTESVYGTLATFVLGVYDPAPDFAVWNEVPYAIEDPEILPGLEALFGGTETLEHPELLPLLAVKRPAFKDGVLGVWSAFALRFEDADSPSGALLVGGEIQIPRINIRVEGGVGFGFAKTFERPSLALDLGAVQRLGTSWNGLVSHELDLGALMFIGSQTDTVLRASYRLNIEAGDWLLRFDVGPGYEIDSDMVAVYFGFGLARVMAVSGGGFF